MMNDAIGGYFPLELNGREHYHADALRLNCARNCFEYILLARGYRKVYIPYYTCAVMLQPLIRNGIEYEFYSINMDFEPTETIRLQDREAFLYTNYYGLKQDCVHDLSGIYGSRLIIDNAQAFYAPHMEGIDTFYSARKFFGVADGAYLYTDNKLDSVLQQDKSSMRMQHLLQRMEEGAEAGYEAFRKNEESLDDLPLMSMSRITESILGSLDYNAISSVRRNNFMAFANSLGHTNQLELAMDEQAVPMVYPYMTTDTSLRQKLISNRIFVAKYWPNVMDWCGSGRTEPLMASNILPLPIDQRYGISHINRIIDLLAS